MKRSSTGKMYKGCAYSSRGDGKPGKPRMDLTTPDFTQRHYEKLAETFRLALIEFPNGDPKHAGGMLHDAEDA